MAKFDGRLIYSTEREILYYRGREGEYDAEKSFGYMIESGNIGYSDMEHKYLCRLDMRVKLDFNTSFNVWIQYDSDGRWIECKRIRGDQTSPKVRNINIMPRRCDHFKIRISGRGKAIIFAISKIFEGGNK